MTTQLLATELANLIQESKRKHNDLRQAAEKSLEELKQLGNVSEQTAPDLLSQKPNFVNPFIIACGTKIAKFTGIAIVCLQRLIVARALPRSKLSQVLEALMQASSAGLDVQLKILQALPSLLQNYASDLNGDLLVTALNICFILQSSKNAIVNNTSAATLQQLVVSVFDKVVAEDKNSGSDAPTIGEAPSAKGNIALRSAALDAYRIFNDLCLMTENQRPEFMRFSGLPQTFGLELIESVITNHAAVFTTHPEQVHILRTRVMPLITSALKGKPTFATTVRLVRILYTLLRRHINTLPSECGEALGILTYLLDHDTALWKRALCMEVFRGIFAEHVLVRRIVALFDAKEGERDVLKTLTATFVRLSTEKPAVIGLGHQSTIPVSSVITSSSSPSDQAILEASGVSGIISGSVGNEASQTGISTQWSSIRVPCIDQLDKTEPPIIPESYIYSLILACISSLSDGLAKFVLPLTVPTDGRSRRTTFKQDSESESPALPNEETDSPPRKTRPERSGSFKKNPIPLNPLQLEGHPLHAEVQICAIIIDECWPAVLATCSTFLYAALDSDYYHGLVRAFQRFAHVAGLLQLLTPRDAFLTTLGKSAVPPNVLTACLNSGQARASTPTASAETANTLFSNARGLLSAEGLAPLSPSLEKRQPSFDTSSATLNTRNLLCLRALLNLGIALGPTLGGAWGIVLETLQQADFVLFSTGKTPGRTPSLNRGQDQISEADANSLMANFATEVRSVETAAARLIESTIDFPNESFVEVVSAICGLLAQQSNQKTDAGSQPPSPTTSGPSARPSPGQHRRILSFSNQASTGSNQIFQFALAKLGEIASINIERLLISDPEASGWAPLTEELIKTLDSSTMTSPVRLRAAEILAKLMLEAANVTVSVTEGKRGAIQLRLLGALRDALVPLQKGGRDASVSSNATDIDIHKIILEGLRGIIEDCGESLISGWEIAFDIIGSVFIIRDTIDEEHRGSVTNPRLSATRSSKLVRSAFSSLQLISSDFLASLPNSCFLILVDTLYKFCSQDDDLNIALTTVTFFWVLSDFLSGKEESLDITAELMQGADVSSLEQMAEHRDVKGSDAALWMLLLLRLTAVTSDDRLELRNSAIQTLLRIFDAYGDRLSPEAWSICIKSVVFKMLSSLEDEIEAAEDGDAEENDQSDWHDTAVVILDGISRLFANYLEVLTTHPSFNHLWREFLGHLTTLLDFRILEINTAIFKALRHVLSQTAEREKAVLNDTVVTTAWDLWSRGIPTSEVANGKDGDNQDCLIAYVVALREVYRLIERDIKVDKVQRMLTLLRETVQEASIGRGAPDVEHVTLLQTQILAAVQTIRADVEGVPSALIKQVSEFVTLAYDQDHSSKVKPKRTYIAMSKASMQILEKLILSHAGDKDIYTSGAFAAALSALYKPIGLKYSFGIATKSTQPWRLATSSTLVVLSAALGQLRVLSIAESMIQQIWSVIADIAGGILSADCEKAPTGTKINDDEDFDIASFRKLRELIIPSLGASTIADRTRKAYAEALFRTSIIHSPASADRAIIEDGHEQGLAALYTSRAGRTTAVPPTPRTQMSYVAFEELFSLISSEQAAVVVQPPTPKSPSFGASVHSEPPSALQARIACIVAPFLILRCGLTLRTYVADQPLRGKMPQPLSQRKELIWTLRKLVDLKSKSEAIPALSGADSDSRKHLLRLYPLLVKALGVTGDAKVTELLREGLEVVGGELGIA